MTACDSVLGIGDLSGPTDAGTDSAIIDQLPECKTQRVVHIIAGNGALAWFTLVWPLPQVVTGFQQGFAYDNPAGVRLALNSTDHPLYSRLIGIRTVWDGLGQNPQPSVFVAGTNEAHTEQPTSITIDSSTGIGIASAGASMQSATQQPPLVVPTVLSFSPGGPYGTAAGAPAILSVANADGAVAAFNTMVPPSVLNQLQPTNMQLANYLLPNAAQIELTFAKELAFTANAFRLGLISTVMIQPFDDDPHTAFDSGAATGRANDLASMLDAFYRDLSGSTETSCGHNGALLQLTDNVMTVVTGDTPKNSFTAAGWPDATAGNANWIYVRSNGFLVPGWFGNVTAAGQRLNFNATTGAIDTSATPAIDSSAAFAAVLYAIARGNKSAVSTFTSAPFDGLVAH